MLMPSYLEKLKELVSGEFKEHFLNSAAYPSPQNQELLLQRLSELYEVDSNHIHVTAGADESIRVISELFCESEDDKVITHSPTYWSYTKFARRFQGAVLDVPLLESKTDFALNTEKILEEIKHTDGSIKVVNIVNPNNPTGSYFEPDDIREIIKAAEEKGITVVLDEAYIEIAQKPSFIPEMDEYPNLIVLRSLSKAYGLAGERIGAIICKNPEFNEALPHVSPMFANTSSSIPLALRATDPSRQSTVQKSWDVIAHHREIIRQAINDNKDMRAFQSHANLILIGVEDAQKAFNAFLESGIAPANPELFGFSRHIRFSLGRQQDTKFIEAAIQAMDLRR